MAKVTIAASHYCFRLLFKNNVTIFRLPSHGTRTLEQLDKSFLGLEKMCLKNKAAACKITQNLMARLIGFAWGKVA